MRGRGRSEGVILWLASHSANVLNEILGPTKEKFSTRIVFRLDTAYLGNVLGCSGAYEIPRAIPGRMIARVDERPMSRQGYFLSND